MTSLYKTDELLKAIKAEKHHFDDAPIASISIDSRTITKNEVFWALEGENYDGHDFVENAIDKGAACAVVTKQYADLHKDKKLPLLSVEDSYQAMLDLACYAKKRTKAKIIAVTGSAGKTTTREMIVIALRGAGKIFAAKKSHNNHIGVPLSLVNMPADTEYGIFELGTSRPGEIIKLAKMTQPDIAVITCIEPAHISNFESMEALAVEKASIFFGMQDKGMGLFSKDCKFSSFIKDTLIKAGVGGVFSFGKSSEAEVQIKKITETAQHQSLQLEIIGEQYELKLSTPGIQYAYCAIMAISVAYLLNADVGKAIDNLSGFVPIEGRGKIHELTKNSCRYTVVDDSYNANPASMKYALKRFAKLAQHAKRRVAVLGEMLELGKDEKNYHLCLLDWLEKARVDKVFLIGEKLTELAKKLKKEQKIAHTDDWRKITDSLLDNVQDGDYILFKGSNTSGVCHLTQYFLKA